MRKHWISALLSLAFALWGTAVYGNSPVKPQNTVKPAPKAAKAPVKGVFIDSPKADATLLPSSFAGWEAAGAAKAVKDSAAADAENSGALKEYGFTDGMTNEYSRNGETLKVKALRFQDASGAYGAYSFYRQSGWPREQVGTGAASFHNRVLFWVGNVVVDSEFPHLSAMSGAELRELAGEIPMPVGNKVLTPPILGDLPQRDIDGQTTHYALGPLGYTGSGGVLPPDLVGFDRGAETATATYKLRSGPATLTVINYPTPQMAAAQEKVISAYLKAGNSAQHPFTKALQDSNPASLEVKRSGPLVAVVSGDAITDEAHKLLAGVHYEADMASVPQQMDSEVKKTAQLLLSIVTLVVVMFAAAVLLALFLGVGGHFTELRGANLLLLYTMRSLRSWI